MPIKINGATSGSTTITAPATGSDETIELSTALASKQADVMTTKGDLAAYGTAVARLAVGTNGQVLTADSGETLGVKWADAAGGLTLVASETFSGVSSVTVNGCFTSTYENYKIVFHASASTSSNMQWLLRVSGVNSTASYVYQSLEGSGGSAGANSGTLAFGPGQALNKNAATWGQMTLQRPNLAANTYALIQTGNSDLQTNYSVEHQVATAYDGFVLQRSAGTMTGELRIYGLAD